MKWGDKVSRAHNQKGEAPRVCGTVDMDKGKDTTNLRDVNESWGCLGVFCSAPQPQSRKGCWEEMMPKLISLDS